MPIDDIPAFPVADGAAHTWAVAQSAKARKVALAAEPDEEKAEARAIALSDEAYIEARARAGAGMSLRAYFAGQALQGLVVGSPAARLSAQVVAKNCREFADALIAELKEGE